MSEANGAHDFDFHVGSWTTHLDRLDTPLTASDRWIGYDGTTTVRPVWGGQANLVELDVTGETGRIRALSLRLFNSDAGQWSLTSSVVGAGTLFPPAFGRFTDGRGEFIGQETYAGRTILVRFVVDAVTAHTCRFEQSFSPDGGATWEVNWVAVDTRTAVD